MHAVSGIPAAPKTAVFGAGAPEPCSVKSFSAGLAPAPARFGRRFAYFFLHYAVNPVYFIVFSFVNLSMFGYNGLGR